MNSDQKLLQWQADHDLKIMELKASLEDMKRTNAHYFRRELFFIVISVTAVATVAIAGWELLKTVTTG